jgi:Undecaprenyl-phosphate glucose phosphotransferase
MSETLSDVQNSSVAVAAAEPFIEIPRPFGNTPFGKAEAIFPRRFRLPRIPDRMLGHIVKAAEIALLWIGAYVAFAHVYGVYDRPPSSPSEGHYLATVVLGTFLWLVVVQRTLRYAGGELILLKNYFLLGLGWTGVVAVLLGLGAALKQDAACREALVWWLAAGAAGLTACRIVAAGYVSLLLRHGLLNRRIVVLGTSGLGGRLARHIGCNAACNLKVVRLYDEPSWQTEADLRERLAYIRDNDIDCVAIALPLAEEARILWLVGELKQLPVDVYVVTDSLSFGRLSAKTPNIAGIPLIVGAERPLKEWRAVAKAVEDWVLAVAGLAFLAPLLLFIALAIKLDSRGPVFFRQPRLGFNQKIFHVFKFRTMYVEVCDKLGDQLTLVGDARITRLGSFLRKSSLDELPQLLNVLAGDMSIVGPRPHPLNAKAADKRYDEVVAGYAARHRVKPGITGWAQVNGWRGQTDTYEKIEKRVEHDLTYIERWSVLFDLKIILKTTVCGFYHRNAF